MEEKQNRGASYVEFGNLLRLDSVHKTRTKIDLLTMKSSCKILIQFAFA